MISARKLILVALVLGALLAFAGSASAATCTFSASGTWDTGSDCNHPPGAGDDVVINSATVSVSGNESAASITMNLGTISFSGSNPTITDGGGFATTSNDTLTGNGTVTVAGTQSHSAGFFEITSGADLILNSTGGIGTNGEICLLGTDGNVTTDDPSLQINGTFTIGAGADSNPFQCNSGLNTAALQVGATGTLVDARSGTASITPPMQLAKGGLVHVTAGTLSVGGGSSTATDDGHWSVDTGTTLQFTGSNVPDTLGADSLIDGDGTFDASNHVTVPLGATFSIANVTIEGELTLEDNASTYSPRTLTLSNGTLSGDRDVTPGTLDIGAGALSGPFTTTIGPSATFTLSAGLGVHDRAHLVFNRDFTISGAANFCLLGTGPGTTDDPAVVFNATFTIGSTATGPFACNSGLDGPAVLIGSTGSLVDDRAGTTSSADQFGNAGTVSIGNGKDLSTPGYVQTGGTTTVASGGTLDGDVTLSGGVLKGGGTLTGSLANTAGTVEPGASPGVLTVIGNYSQGSGGTLQTEIDGTSPGTQYDQLAVGGGASLAGTLAIVTGGGFTPALSDTFDVVTASGAVSGTFASLTGAQLTGERYSAQYTAGPPGKATLTLASTPVPGNQTPPSIPSSAHPGDNITCNPGTWTGSPSFTFQWLRDGAPIASGSSYVVAAGDVGHTLVCRVTATNQGGSTNADSNTLVPSAVVVAQPVAPPANTAPPTIPSSATVSDVLRCDPGTWTGSPTFTFQWLRDGSAVATGQFFAVGSGDAGHLLTCRVTATNAGGSASAPSNSVAPQAPPVAIAGLPAAQGCVPGGLSVGIGVRSAGLKNMTAFLDGKRVFTTKKAHSRLVIPKGRISAGQHKLRIVATYRTGKLNKNFRFVKCRGGGRSPGIRIGGAPSRTACTSSAFTFHALISGAVPSSVRLTLDGRPLAKPGKLNFTRTIDVTSLSAGPHEAIVIASDKFGNTSRDAIDFLRC